MRDYLTVDVILPVYKGKQWLKQAVDSVVAQTYPHWHLTVVDDASPDDTLAYARQLYGASGEHISFMRLEESRQAPGARMAAIRQTDGDVIAFLDQDDRWHPEKLAQQMAHLHQSSRLSVVHTDVQHIDPAGNVLVGSARRENAHRATIPFSQLTHPELTRHLFIRNSIRLVSAVVRRNAFMSVGGFDGLPFGAEDWGVWVRLAGRGHAITHLAKPLVDRRLHGRNVSSRQRLVRIQGMWEGMELMVAEFPELESATPQRRVKILREEILAHLAAGTGWQVRGKIRQYIALGERRLGLAFLLVSYLGPLQGPVARHSLQLVRRYGAP